jgi:hypothetical protein
LKQRGTPQEIAALESPCSVPDWLRLLIPFETLGQRLACQDHDADYAEGGGRRARLMADLRFAVNLLHADMDPDLVEKYYWAVRMYGAGHWNGKDDPGAMPIYPHEPHQAP